VTLKSRTICQFSLPKSIVSSEILSSSVVFIGHSVLEKLYNPVKFFSDDSCLVACDSRCL